MRTLGSKIALVAWIGLVILLASVYNFGMGAKYGIDGYKRSRNMAMALESAYRFGYMDGKGN